LAEQLTCNQ